MTPMPLPFAQWHAENCIGLMSDHPCPDPQACLDAWTVEVRHEGRAPCLMVNFTDLDHSEEDPVDGECDDDGDLLQLGEELREAEGED